MNPGSAAGARFIGDSRQYWRILARDAGLLIATVGLYRFWVANDVRTYLWSHTEIAGDELEYTGDPLELLVGFLVLVAIFGPLFAAASIAAVMSGQPAIAILLNNAAIICLVPIAVLALYQARRYRMSHTLFRGLRFRQTGSAWIYALRTAAWFVVNVLTLGLTYPLARKSLERYKMRHAFYGDVQGDFQGQARRLFKTGFWLWLIVLVPTALLLIPLLPGKVAPTAEDTQATLVLAGGWFAPAGLIVYPGFHATVLRWRIGGMRFGPVALGTQFPTWSLYKAYLRFLGLMAVLAIVVGAGVAIWQLKILPAVPSPPSPALAFAGFVALAFIYFAIATAISFAYQATVRLTVWRLIVNGLSLGEVEALDNAKAIPGWTPRHEGRIAGSLNIGGF